LRGDYGLREEVDWGAGRVGNRNQKKKWNNAREEEVVRKKEKRKFDPPPDTAPEQHQHDNRGSFTPLHRGEKREGVDLTTSRHGLLHRSTKVKVSLAKLISGRVLDFETFESLGEFRLDRSLVLPLKLTSDLRRGDYKGGEGGKRKVSYAS